MLLAEFDPTPRAVINPDFIHKPVEHFPETVISVFSHRLFASVAALLEGQVIAETHDADGVWPVYAVHYREKRLGFCKARVGAPACVGQFEDIIAMGAKRIILLGNCGVLDKRIEDCGIIIPTPFTGKPPQRSPPDGAWARCAWRWSVRPCRPYVISGVWNFFSISTPGTIWIIPNGTPEACPAIPGYPTKRKLPCWPSSWPAESAE